MFGIKRTLYHITPTENLPSIFIRGLIPTVGERSSDKGRVLPAVHCFSSAAALAGAGSAWALGNFSRHEQVSILEVRAEAVVDGGEARVRYIIPPKDIRVIEDDELTEILSHY